MEKQEWTFGPLNARFEAPDILFSWGEGETDGESMRAFNRLAEELAQKHGPLYLITDMSKSSGMTPEARKASTEYTGSNPFAAVVFCGGNFAIRTVVNMLIRASKLLKNNEAPMQFVENEAAAREWIAEQKRRTSTQRA